MNMEQQKIIELETKIESLYGISVFAYCEGELL